MAATAGGDISEESRSGAVAGALLERFTRNAADAAAIVHHCHDTESVVRLVVALAAGGVIGASPTLTARYPELVEMLDRSAVVIRPESATEATRSAVGVAVGEALVVETGSVLVSEYELADRVVSMLSPVLVQLVPASAVLATFEEVGEHLSRSHAGGIAGYHALVTGPSRSADIERSLTVGVQGPAEMHIVLLYDPGSEGGGE